MKGLTLAEVLIALIVAIIGYGVFVSAQGFLVKQTLDTSDIIMASRLVSDIYVLYETIEPEKIEFEGTAKDFFAKFRLPEKILSDHDFDSFTVEIFQDSKPVNLKQEIQVPILNFEITSKNGRLFTYKVVRRSRDK
ncbi:MAG: hypothetical protein NZT61_02635 [Deltaproteobacteria bacterium]|nr:hypothetical protein [Deltaproteobacteria bacterium]MCX7952288.1 hypothetical protein [Deltaproteobacteria bacterium]